MENKLSKKVGLRLVIIRFFASLFVYVPFIAVLVISEDSYEIPEIKYMLVGVLSLFTLFAFIVNFITPWFMYRLSFYEIKDEAIVFQRGVIFRQQTHLPIKRIQHVEKRQGPIQMLLNVSSVAIYTAGSLLLVFDIDNTECDSLVAQIKSSLDVVLSNQETESSDES